MPQTPLSSPSEEQQEKLLDEAMSIVKVQAFQMKCCLDKNKLMEALKHASNMLGELRTSLLSPKQYYELFMAVTDHLRHLDMYLVDEFQRGRKMADLYELVQYAGNIIPRLYLLITVGLVYMKTVPGCRREILKDLVEMCRGVQHPLRGLFLRNYLLQSCRNVLPDVDVEEASIGGDGTEKENHSGTVQDSIDFILLNFAEMNKLWVRMQHQGHSRDRDKREKERQELRLLVGTNLVRLSQLDAVNLERYKNVVLAGLLEQVVSCRDAIAQEYLMECLIQVFPDEYHLATLTPFLNSCAQLSPSVNVKNVIIALIDRLASSKDIDLPSDLFDVFSKQIANIISSRREMPCEDVIGMEASLINFALRKIDEEHRDEAIDSVLESTMQVIKDKMAGKIHLKTNLGKELLRFLKLPICCSANSSISGTTQHIQMSGLASIKMSLKLNNFRKLVKEVCDMELQKQVVLVLLNAALDDTNAAGEPVSENESPENKLSQEEVDIFFNELCQPLLANKSNNMDDNDEADEDFIDEQTLLSRFIHYILSSSPSVLQTDELDSKYLILSSLRKCLIAGGPKSIRYTFPSLVFEALRLSLKYADNADSDPKWAKKCSTIFKFVHQTITTVAKENSSCPELCLRLFLEAALNVSKINIETREQVAYEFISQAFTIYEEEISDSKAQVACLQSIIGTAYEIKFVQEENLNPLRSQCCKNGANLVKKSDQCKAILAAAALFKVSLQNEISC